MSTTTTTLNDLVGGQAVANALAIHVPTPVAMMIAWSMAAPEGTNGTMVLPRYDLAATNAGNKAENATFASVAIDTSGVTVTGGMVGHRSQPSWAANNQALESALDCVTVAGRTAIYNRIDIDLMTAASGATYSTDLGTAALTETDVLAHAASYTAQVPHMGNHALVLYPKQISDWAGDLFANGGSHLGGNLESERVGSLVSPNQGAMPKTVRHGFAVYESSNVVVAAGEATGFSCKMGDMGALALVTWKPIDVESEWQPTSQSWNITVSAFYGVAISDPDNIRSLISRSA